MHRRGQQLSPRELQTSKNDPAKREMALVSTPAFTKSAEHLRSASIAQSLDKGVGISAMKGNAGKKGGQEKEEE